MLILGRGKARAVQNLSELVWRAKFGFLFELFIDVKKAHRLFTKVNKPRAAAMRFSILFILGRFGLSRAADDGCSTLATFANTCVDSTDEQFEDLCNDFTTLQSEWCIDEGEFVVFYLDQARLVECREPDGPLDNTDYNKVERFKYQCADSDDFNGPCNLLEQFETECIEPLSDDVASLTAEQFCGLSPSDPDAPAVPVTCFTQARHLFGLDQQFLAGCTDELNDYFTVERFKYECAAYDSTCSNLEHFIERCGPTEYNTNDAALCEVYVWGETPSPSMFHPGNGTFDNQETADFCINYAPEYLQLPQFEVFNCDPDVDDTELGFFYRLRDKCDPFFETMPSPAPTASPAPTSEAQGPCGLLQAFEDRCLSELTASSDFGPTCEALVWHADEEEDEVGDDDVAYCARLSPTVFNLPESNFENCASPAMDATAYSLLEKLRTDCAPYIALKPTPAPTSTPAPTYPEYGGPCTFLENFATSGCVSAGDNLFAKCAEFAKIEDDPQLVGVEDDAAIVCIGQAQTVLDLPNNNFDYCGREGKTSAASFGLLTQLRAACSAPAPSNSPTKQPAAAVLTPATTPVGGPSSDSSSNKASSAASSSTLLLGILLPLAVLAIMAAVWFSRGGGGVKAVVLSSRYADHEDDDDDDEELEVEDRPFGGRNNQRRYADDAGDDGGEVEMRGGLSHGGSSSGGGRREPSVDRAASQDHGGDTAARLSKAAASAPASASGDQDLWDSVTEFDAPTTAVDFDSFVSANQPSSSALPDNSTAQSNVFDDMM